MQIKLTIALVAATFALASYPAFAADMPVDGTKNFTAPGDAPSYFTNETAPASARVANQATFTGWQGNGLPTSRHGPGRQTSLDPPGRQPALPAVGAIAESTHERVVA
jgi:hypothetical protein